MLSDDSGDNMKKIRFETCLKIRELEIELFWKRALFFGGFIAAAAVAYTTVLGKSQRLATVIACFGVVCSFAWTLANRGSKYWQENWEEKVAQSEDDVTGRLFKDPEGIQDKGIWLSARKYSVSRLAIALSDYLVILWIAILIYQIAPFIRCYYLTNDVKDLLVIAFSVFSLIFAVLLLCCCRTKLK